MVCDDYLGEYALLVDKWFRGTAFAFNSRNNQVHHFTTEDMSRDFTPPPPQPFSVDPSFPHAQPQPCAGLCASKPALSNPPTRWVCSTLEKPTTH